MSFGLILFAILSGWIGGGLVNWAADILPGLRDRPTRPALQSHLPSCSHDWTWPCLLWRSATCPHCRTRLGWRPPVVRVACVALFALMAWHWGTTPTLAVAWLYGLFLIAVTVIDLEHQRVLNRMLAPAAVVVALLSLLPAAPQPHEMLLGGVVGFGLFLLLAIIGRGALGMGDVKLAGVIGMMLGYPDVLTALTIGAVLGALMALLLLVSRRATRKTAIAYAPYLAVGALMALWTMGR